MSQTVNTSIRCSRCHQDFSCECYTSINVAGDPELKTKVKSGEIFVKECPCCGTVNLVTSPVLYHDPEEMLMIWLTDGNPATERAAREVFISTPGLEHYTGRLVSDVGSLMEKVKIFDAGLDDVVVELSKFVTAQELGKDVKLKFVSLDGADNTITLTYPKDGKMEMVEIGFNVYEDCRGIVKRNPSMQERSKGLVRIDADWVAGFIR